jgi:hypothetical protein
MFEHEISIYKIISVRFLVPLTCSRMHLLRKLKGKSKRKENVRIFYLK